MRPLDEKPPTISTEEQRARLKRRLNFIFGWLVLPVYVGALIWVLLTWQSWSATSVAIGFVLLVAYGIVVLFGYGGVNLYRSRGQVEPTEWMRRGGLMASPEASARPDDARINAALGALPADFRPQARDAVEAYLAMTDDDEKQLCRDRLIREFYDLAGSDRLDFNHRRAFNALRLALSPWADSGSDT
ncbi:MAG TPA: hypothetical protein VID24_10915 [Candidatus Eremiobacteraceae bacterium]